MRFSKEKEDKIIEMYLSNIDTVQIGKYFNTWNTSIRRVLLRRNIPIRSNGVATTYLTNPVFQKEILNREESYFLGLLITDGCISNNTLTLGLKEEDVYMLERYAKFLGPKVSVNKYFHTKHNKYQYEVKGKNKKIINRLQQLANFINKSFDLILYYPLNFDVLRGIIDGDGYITKEKGYVHIFKGSKNFLIQIQEFLKKYNIYSSIHKTHSCWKLSILRQKDIIFLYEKMYYSTDLFLLRKKERFGPLLEKFKSKNDINSGNFCQES